MRSFLPLFVTAGVLWFAPLTPLAAAEKPPAAPTATAILQVMPLQGVKSSGPGRGVRDFGRINAFATPSISHAFMLRNDSQVPVMVLRQQASCGCTSTVVGENQELPRLVQPGQTLRLGVTVDITGFSGPITKSVWLYGLDNTSPLAVVEMVGNVQEAVAFAPQVANFGQVTAGSTRFLPVKVKLAPGMSLPRWPELVSSNPGIRVAPVTAGKTNARGERSYLLSTLPGANPGPIIGTVGFNLPEQGLEQKVRVALQRAILPLNGDIIGPIKSEPGLVFFGTHWETPQRLTIQYPRQAGELQVKVTLPDVTARQVEEPTREGDTVSTVWEFTLKPGIERRNLAGKVNLSTTGGGRLSLQIVALAE